MGIRWAHVSPADIAELQETVAVAARSLLPVPSLSCLDEIDGPTQVSIYQVKCLQSEEVDGHPAGQLFPDLKKKSRFSKA